jgi:hypothetical protein
MGITHYTRSLTALLLALIGGPAAAQDAPAQTPARPPATFYGGDWGFTIGGRIKLDMIHDFDAITSTDSFDPRTIVVPETAGTNWRIHAREARLSLGIAGPANGRQLRMFIEGDFYGTGNAFRLRHAYGQYGVLLVGQTWSTFMDEDNVPNTIDFETPLAAPLVRQGLVRLTFPVSQSAMVAFGVEEADPEVVSPAGVSGAVEKPMPDITARFRFTGGAGHVQLSGFVGKTRYRATGGDTDDAMIGGVLLSGRLRLFGSDAAYTQVAYGPGLGRYRGGVSAAPDVSNNLTAVEAFALTTGYEHWWSDRWSSNVVFSPAWALDDIGVMGTANTQLTYAAANLFYWFIPNRAWVGGEYLFGRREVSGGTRATANRIQFAVRFNIPG